MNQIESKIKEKSKKIIIIMFLFLFLLQSALLVTWYLGKKSSAELVANGIHNLLFTGDVRAIIEILSPITPTTFSKFVILNASEIPIVLTSVNSNYISFDIPIYEYQPINSGLSVIFYANLNQILTASLLFVIIISIFGYYTFLYILSVVRSSFEKELALQVLSNKESIFKQVAHDIRSPLSALNIITSSLTGVTEEKRLLIRNSVQRINDIANDLLQKGKSDFDSTGMNSFQKFNKSYKISNSRSNTTLSDDEHCPLEKNNFSFLISTVVDNIVSEKRIQFREKINVSINVDLKESFGLFVNANPNELSRVISNLINNSVESLPNHSGNIDVSVIGSSNNYVCIQVKDNGSGIPKHILEKLGQAGITHGKENTQSGSGLGVYHAMKVIQEFGGSIHFNSVFDETTEMEENKFDKPARQTGTTITINLPKANTPVWFANSINLKPGEEFVTVDDDISIHQIWKGRLESLKSKDYNIQISSFTSAKEFREYFDKNLKYKLSKKTPEMTSQFELNDKIIFLIDYEFLSQNDDGLKIITDLSIQDKAILVTSRFDEPNIRRECEVQKIKILPKQLAGQIPIMLPAVNLVGTTLANSESVLNIDSSSTQEKLCKYSIPSKYDLCLIDDDKLLIHSIWNMVAKEKGLNIKLFERPEDFLTESSLIDKTTPIYIDVSLGNNVSGVEFSKEIYKLGFENINLATGYDAETINVPTFIRKVIGKDFPDTI